MANYTSDFTGESYDQKKFLEVVEKRVRKELRVHSELDVKLNYALIDDNRLSTKVLLFLLDNIFSGRLTVALFEKKEDSSKGTIELCSDVLEEYISKRLEAFFNKGKLDELLGTVITPLKIVTAHEIEEIAKIKDFDGVSPEKESEFITKLHDKYPQTKMSMVKSFNFLQNLRTE